MRILLQMRMPLHPLLDHPPEKVDPGGFARVK